jgi:uncharacterized protein YndB with AHSA1/START domain
MLRAVETTVRTTVQVHAPVERVWEVLVDPHGPPAQRGVVVGRSWGTPGTVGSGYEAVVRNWPVRGRVVLTVVEAEPPERIVVEQRYWGRVFATSSCTLQPSGDWTRLSMTTTCPGLFARLSGGMLRRSQDRQLALLKAELRT